MLLQTGYSVRGKGLLDDPYSAAAVWVERKVARCAVLGRRSGANPTDCCARGGPDVCCGASAESKTEIPVDTFPLSAVFRLYVRDKKDI
jgi:hypothetical protein